MHASTLRSYRRTRYHRLSVAFGNHRDYVCRPPLQSRPRPLQTQTVRPCASPCSRRVLTSIIVSGRCSVRKNRTRPEAGARLSHRPGRRLQVLLHRGKARSGPFCTSEPMRVPVPTPRRHRPFPCPCPSSSSSRPMRSSISKRRARVSHSHLSKHRKLPDRYRNHTIENVQYLHHIEHGA